MGSKRRALSQLLYLGVGLAGFPIFTSGGGITYVLKPTFGYLIGFVLASYLVGKLVEKQSNLRFRDDLLANFAGMIPVYACGVLYLYLSMNTWVGESASFWYVFMTGVVLNVAGDVILCFAAAIVAVRLQQALPHLPHVSTKGGR
ncbi:biotin transporter BioY [Brevibacillus massiliensis]|uniref:biotin transporter BioY n=1 Tax=Brevibacillus massiliensis TaxID=1118054 RepID=UPI0002F0CACA|nr:biotin transporter BioY [Brevibacillus massiliensis]